MPSRADLAKIHIAKKELGLCNDTYRAMLRNIAGVESAKDLNNMGIAKVLTHLKDCGWKPHRGRTLRSSRKFDELDDRAGMASPGMLRKIEAIWAEVCYTENPEGSLRRFLFNRFRVSDLKFLDLETAGKVVEALKKIRQRAYERSLQDR